ncbi:MAG: hypothetical protein HFF72_11380, partial [Oscillospiraceae bacterium]|nr:hypothetical protein [Oscillospiraceae bacterium]
EREGILKNVTGGDFGAPAPRQMVAEILFRGLLHETMQYSPLTPDGYTKSGETLGKRVGLSEVEGVVMANELASLLDNDVLAEGKTQLDDNLIDYTTDFDDIGERKLAYLKDGKTVLSIEDSSKNTREFTLDASSLKDLLKKASLNAGDAEHFINFAEVDKYTTPYRIRYVLQVEDDGTGTKVLVGSDNVAQDVADSIKAANGAAVVEYNDATDDEISVVLKPKSEVSRVDLKWMEYIFADGDLSTTSTYEVGEIYVNTQSTKDISDDPDYYYEKFVETFLTYDDNKTTIDGNEKGNWLKVIDNDADGKADYVLKVIYTGAQVERIKNDKITLDVKNHALASHDRLSDGVRDNQVNTLTNQSVVNMSSEALEEGDVVYYAIIDGVARAYKAEMVTATIDKINRNTKSTTTTDGDEYFESAVCSHIIDPEYKDEVTDLVGKVNFDLYFDRGGWLMTFVKSNRAGDFKLITDGWFSSTKSGDEYAARVYNDEEDKQEVVDLTSGGSKFIGRDVVYVDSKGVAHTTDNNDWDALKYLGATADTAADSSALDNNMAGAPTYNPNQIQAGKVPADLNGGYVTTGTNALHNRIKTTVASIDEEGNILPVEDYRIAGRYDHLMIALDNDKIPTSAYSSGTSYVTDGDTAYDSVRTDVYGNPITVELRALSTTKYYVVWPSGSGVGVKAFTGYANAKDIAKLATSRGGDALDLVEDIYAVGTLTRRDNEHRDEDYYTADVVVIELNREPTNARSIVLLVDDEGQVDKTGVRHVQVVDKDGSSKWIDVDSYESSQLMARTYEKKLTPGLYWCSENGDDVYKLEALTPEEIRDSNFITGQVQYYRGTTKNDYVVVNPAFVADGRVWVDTYHDNTLQPIITENSKFYTLGYGYAINAQDYRENPANLSNEGEESYREVLAGRVEGVDGGSAGDPKAQRDYYDTGDRQSYFYNDVMILVNGDNEIVYAVSFQNTYNSKGDADFAQQVWANVAPAGEADTNIYIPLEIRAAEGEEVTVEGIDGVVYDGDNTGKELKLPGEGFFQIKVTVSEGVNIDSIVINAAGCTKEGVKVDENGAYIITFRYIEPQTKAVAAVEDTNVIATVKYVQENIIAEINNIVIDGVITEGKEAEYEALMGALEIYASNEVADQTVAADAEQTIKDAIQDAEDAAAGELTEAVNAAKVVVQELFADWKNLYDNEASDEYKAKLAVANEYQEKIAEAASPEEVDELIKEAVLAMADDVNAGEFKDVISERNPHGGKFSNLDATIKVDIPNQNFYIDFDTVEKFVFDDYKDADGEWRTELSDDEIAGLLNLLSLTVTFGADEATIDENGKITCTRSRDNANFEYESAQALLEAYEDGSMNVHTGWPTDGEGACGGVAFFFLPKFKDGTAQLGGLGVLPWRGTDYETSANWSVSGWTIHNINDVVIPK